MALPVNVSVEAVPNFHRGLEVAREFFVEQDEDSAGRRAAKLRAKLSEMMDILAWSPASGRPARFHATRSAQARLRLAPVLDLAKQTGMPELREYVVDQHTVLYAHSDTQVLLLAIKHQRQLAYVVVDDATNGPE
ncbi:hypothetical protein [Bordetella genomosp. 11]|uniref:Uncharacterized protein n=1 Tax=Bordetella genomosp. 11 TaxID=1416808 RepID=A0A261UBV3_9BORD|nr:hypothetical protein [Bordetella genomosp. 11]OZI59418.1 hypothetical protein CAL28_07655 [Bordetella genomosp. 11]